MGQENSEAVQYQRLIHGLTRILGHCLFAWTETVEVRPERTYELGPDHCEACVRELQAVYPTARFVVTNGSVNGVEESTPTSPPDRARRGRK